MNESHPSIFSNKFDQAAPLFKNLNILQITQFHRYSSLLLAHNCYYIITLFQKHFLFLTNLHSCSRAFPHFESVNVSSHHHSQRNGRDFRKCYVFIQIQVKRILIKLFFVTRLIQQSCIIFHLITSLRLNKSPGLYSRHL